MASSASGTLQRTHSDRRSCCDKAFRTHDSTKPLFSKTAKVISPQGVVAPVLAEAALDVHAPADLHQVPHSEEIQVLAVLGACSHHFAL